MAPNSVAGAPDLKGRSMHYSSRVHIKSHGRKGGTPPVGYFFGAYSMVMRKSRNPPGLCLCSLAISQCALHVSQATCVLPAWIRGL